MSFIFDLNLKVKETINGLKQDRRGKIKLDRKELQKFGIAVKKHMGIREDFPDFMHEIYDPSVHEWGTEEGREYAQDFTPYEPVVDYRKLTTWREQEDLPKKVLLYKEKMYKKLKKERDDFVKRYGEIADEIMHGTAMQMAKRKYGYS